jgi:chemotaxis protein MotB
MDMRFKNSFYSAVLLSLMAFAACVPQKKFLAMSERANRLHRDSVNFYNQILGLTGSLSRLQLEQEMTSDRLKKNKEELSQTKESLTQTKESLTQSKETIAAQQARLLALQKMIEQQRQASEALHKKITQALGAFNADQLTVSLKNGKVYVSMSEQLLFASGSADVAPEGKAALSTLAAALNQNPDININIEGHTDSIPIAKKFVDNWALSVARSTAIARILIKDYQVQPMRIISSGRAEYFPVADNSTPEGRARNRRTEIILEPKLDKILELVAAQNDAADQDNIH